MEISTSASNMVEIKKKQIAGFINIDGDSADFIENFVFSGNVVIEEKTLNRCLKNIGVADRMLSFKVKTVKEAIENNLKEKEYKKEEIEKRIIGSLKTVGLDSSYLDKKPSNLSIGEQKKILLVLSLAHNPKIILLDEPSLGIDFRTKQNLIKLLRMLKVRYNKTILINSTDLDFIYEIADYLYVLENGKIVKEGDKYTVFKWISNNKKEIKLPTIIEFSNYVKKTKGINLGYRDNIDDLAKDIYRNI